MYQESFAFYLSILRKQFVSYCTEKLSDLGITYNQLFVLIYISKKKDCFPKEIAEYLNLDAGQLNRTLAKLSEKELITQQKSQKDKRFQLLNITAKGFDVVEQSKTFFHQWDRQILSTLEPDSQQELLQLMKQILLSQKESTGGTKNECNQ